MSGEEHMKFTWSYELVAPGTIAVLIESLQKSVKKKDGRYVVQLDDVREKFSKLYGFTKDVSSKHFNEPIRLLRKSGIIWIEKGKQTADVIKAGAGTEFGVDGDILNVDVTSDQKIFEYVAKRAYEFHIPFKLLITIINEYSVPIAKEVLKERLSEDMLACAKANRPDYFLEKKKEMEQRRKPVEKWRYSLSHLNALLAIAKKAKWISEEAGKVQGISKKEVKISYPEFKGAVFEEYNKIIGRDVTLLMVPIDELKSSICKKFRINEKMFDYIMRTLILRNMGKIRVYSQKTKEDAIGLRLPDNTLIYSITLKGEQLL
ncbi:MAG: hypothetical protein OEY22_05545 [Candidatus Bathyarchaeota archaeon]|nr:hypothetical protein [Candidatus Bathyarchaeota archaeon]